MIALLLSLALSFQDPVLRYRTPYCYDPNEYIRQEQILRNEGVQGWTDRPADDAPLSHEPDRGAL